MATEEGAAPDWERIEGDYRAGVLSLREIAAKDGNVTEGAIRKRAKRDGWDRDLNAKIKARADSLVRKAAVRSEVRSANQPTEREIIDANAQSIADIQGGHKASSARLMRLAGTLLAELENQSADPALLEQLGELMRKPDEKGVDKLNDIYQKVISTPSRVDSLKKIAESHRHAIGLEREAWGLDDKKPGAGEGGGEINITF